MPGAGFLDAAISSSIMVLIPTSSCTESTRLDAPSSSCTTATKLNCLQSPLFPLDRGGYGKIGDSLQQNMTLHKSFFHPFPLPRTQAHLRIFNGSCGTRIMGKFKKRKGTREGSMWPWYLAPRLLQKISRSAWVWSSQFIWELMAKKLMSNGFSYDKDIFANVPSFGKFQARLLELHTKEP